MIVPLAPTLAQTPPHNWLFAVSCLDFKSRDFAAIPEEGRTDGDVVKSFGDPARVTWLKKQDANTKRIDFEFREMLRRVKPGDDLIVFYTGHGYRRKGKLYLATWNADIGNQGWVMERAFAQIKQMFRGKRLAFFADCCAAGQLATLAQGTGKTVAVLGSSSGAEAVAMDWNFSTALAHVFSGSTAPDENRDGKVDWNETVAYVRSQIGRDGTVFAPSGFELAWPAAH